MHVQFDKEAGITLEAIMQGIEASELLSGRNELYVAAEVKLDMPLTWEHYRDGLLQWRKTMSSAAYRVWRYRGFK